MLNAISAALAILGAADLAAAGLTGPYVPARWTLANSTADGSISTTDASAILTGGDMGGGEPGLTEWRITLPYSGAISFDWRFVRHDNAFGPWDAAGWRVGEQSTQLAANNSSVTNGHVAFTGTAGAVFAIWVSTVDNVGGRGELQLSNITFPLPAEPRIHDIHILEGTVSFWFDSEAGRNYHVEATESLTNPNWTQVGPNIVAQDARTTFSTSKGMSNTFFRIVAP